MQFARLAVLATWNLRRHTANDCVTGFGDTGARGPSGAVPADGRWKDKKSESERANFVEGCCHGLAREATGAAFVVIFVRRLYCTSTIVATCRSIHLWDD